ncbi:MAG: hypothetical protein F6K39_00945 [Okeania sp. SIO3B3]|nr:hypothetical protein [Okeania sp. SIO3B3]
MVTAKQQQLFDVAAFIHKSETEYVEERPRTAKVIEFKPKAKSKQLSMDEFLNSLPKTELTEKCRTQTQAKVVEVKPQTKQLSMENFLNSLPNTELTEECSTQTQVAVVEVKPQTNQSWELLEKCYTNSPAPTPKPRKIHKIQWYRKFFWSKQIPIEKIREWGGGGCRRKATYIKAYTHYMDVIAVFDVENFQPPFPKPPAPPVTPNPDEQQPGKSDASPMSIYSNPAFTKKCNTDPEIIDSDSGTGLVQAGVENFQPPFLKILWEICQ